MWWGGGRGQGVPDIHRTMGIGGSMEHQVVIHSWSARYGAYLCDVQEAPRAAAGQIDQWGYRILVPVLQEGQQACMKGAGLASVLQEVRN